VNRRVFKSRQQCLQPTAASHKLSGSEFQTVGLATEKYGFQQMFCVEHAEQMAAVLLVLSFGSFQ